MLIPDRYIELRKTSPIVEVSFGCGGIYLFPLEDLAAYQVGYSVTPDGTSLEGGRHGDWRSTWLAIGYETALGDPLFLDSGQSSLPVYTAMHGEGAWNPEQISISFEAFLRALAEFSRLSVGRTGPGYLEANPLDERSRHEFLMLVSGFNEKRLDTNFWSVLLQG